ncbi:hypothetical protein AB0950_38445 [Streptomyces sp. NPDC007189]|uniref:hypothetical protein n=1 Tax=Streptomyces sp. NPDC007189 TaxID=3154315 RepID=UPI003453CA02
MTEHAVIVKYQLSGDGFGSEQERQEVRRMETQLRTAIDQAGVGEFDGDEFGGGAVTIYTYGPDADALFAAAKDALRGLPLRPAVAVLRYGEGVDAQEVHVNL